MLTSLGVNFWREIFFGGGGLKPWEDKAEKVRHQNSLRSIRRQFSSKKFASPKSKSHPESTLCRTSGSRTTVVSRQAIESAKIPFTLPMAKTKTMVLVFGFSFPFSAGFQGKSGFSFGKKWFYFLVSIFA